MKITAFAMVLMLAAATAWSGELVQTITFDQNQLKTLDVGQYQLLTLPGYATSSDPGKPSLPQVVQSLALPAGAVITGVKVIAQDERPLPGAYDIAPAQHAAPLPMPGLTFSYPPIAPDKSVYDADQVYPHAPIVTLGSGTMCGYSIGRIEIYPVRYNPVTRTAYFTSSLTYAVSYQLNKTTGSVPTQFQQETFGRMMRSFVANPNDVVSFAPPVHQSGAKTLAAGSYRYVTISGAPSFDTVFARLAAWKTSKGVRDTVIPVAWITGTYTGYDNAEKIRNFIIDAKNTWGTVYVLLGGRGDDKNSGQNFIPARHAQYTAAGAGYYADEDQIPSDLYYSDLDGTWDGNGNHTYGETADGCNLYPDVYVGRAPVATVAQAQNFVAKVLTYEKAPPTGYLKKMLLPAGILWSSYEERPTQRAIIRMTPTGWTDDTLFERSNGISEATFVSHFNTGNGFGHWMGHGNEVGIYWNGGSSAFYTSTDADAASNGTKLGVYNSIACFTGAWDEVSGGSCFAEHIVNRVGGGAVGVMMNSRYGWGAVVGGGYVMGPSEMIDTTYWHRVFYDGIYNMGQVLASAKTAWVPYADQSNQYSYMRWCLYETNLLGDPELPLWTNEADSLRLTYNSTVPTGSGSCSVTVKDRSNAAVSGALICLRTKTNGIYATGTTNSSGVASITINPSAAETLFIAATARDKYAAFGYALINGTATPTLAVSMTTWSPAAAGATSSAVSVTNSGSTSAIAYTVSSNQTWLTVSSASGSTPGSFTMTAAANTGAARTATVTVTATTSGVANSPQSIAVSQAAGSSQVTIFSDDMTNFPTGWTLSPTAGWTKSSTRANSASYSARCDDASPYANSQTNTMARSVSLTGYTSATLTFFLWQYTESGYDYVYVDYYSGSAWTMAWSRAGSYQSWAQQSVTIPTTATQVRFRFTSDASVTYEGAYVDDVVLTATSGGSSGAWTDVAATTQSAHPYTNSYNNTWTITGPTGAAKMKVYFDSIKTESGYDSVYVLNSAGTVISKWSGTYRAVWSGEVSGNVVKIQLKSDASVTGYGFLNTKYSYYTTTLNRQGAEMAAGRLPGAGGELLSQNAPNPVIARTRICYNLPGERTVSLKIYNLNGQLVRTLASGAQPSGFHAVEWDARDDAGNGVATGVYLYRLVAGDLSATKKLTVMR